MVQSIAGVHSLPFVLTSMNACAVNEHDPAFNQTPLTALSGRTRQQLARQLNSKRLLRSEEGYERDWRGLAELAHQKHLRDALTVENPVEMLLQAWLKNNPQSAKIGYLEHFLGTIDRWDVCDEIQENLTQDTENYNTRKQQQHFQSIAKISSSPPSISATTMTTTTTTLAPVLPPMLCDFDILTNDDVDSVQNGLPLPTYDAFVLYADADLNFATEIMTELENNPRYNFKFYLKDRDSLAGVVFENLSLTRLIEERCKRLIIVLTQEFLQSPENKFLLDYTQTLQIESNTRKIVPIIYEMNINIPRTLRIYTPLRYRPNSPFNFWDKLAKAIRDVDGGMPMPLPLPVHNVADLHVAIETTPIAAVAAAAAAATTPRIVITDCPKPEHYEKHAPTTASTSSSSPPRRLYKSRSLAQSVGQLHISEAPKSLMTSSASIVSTPPPNEKHNKKKKWYKTLTKLVRRSSSKKLPEPC